MIEGERIMLCRECGTENIDRARFCVGCGAPLTAPLPVVLPEVPAPAAVTAPPRKRWAVCAAVVLVVLAVVMCFALLLKGGEDYEDVAERFVTAWIENDQDTLAEVLHPRLYAYLQTADLLNTGKMTCEAESIGAEPCTESEQQELRTLYTLLGTSVPFTEAYQVEVEYTVRYGTEEKTSVAHVSVCEIDGVWLVVNVN